MLERVGRRMRERVGGGCWRGWGVEGRRLRVGEEIG